MAQTPTHLCVFCGELTSSQTFRPPAATDDGSPGGGGGGGDGPVAVPTTPTTPAAATPRGGFNEAVGERSLKEICALLGSLSAVPPRTYAVAETQLYDPAKGLVFRVQRLQHGGALGRVHLVDQLRPDVGLSSPDGAVIVYPYTSSVSAASATTLFQKLGMFPLAVREAVHVTEYSAVKFFMEAADHAPVLVERWPAPFPRYVIRVALHVTAAQLPGARMAIHSFVKCLGLSVRPITHDMVKLSLTYHQQLLDKTKEAVSNAHEGTQRLTNDPAFNQSRQQRWQVAQAELRAWQASPFRCADFNTMHVTRLLKGVLEGDDDDDGGGGDAATVKQEPPR